MSVLTDKRSGRLFIQFEYKGQLYKKRFPEDSDREDVEKFELKWKHSLVFGGVLATDAPDDAVLFEEFVEDVYLPYAKANYCADSFEQAKKICKAAMPFLGGKALHEIKPFDIERFKAARMTLPTQHGTVRKPATVHRELSILSKVLSMAEKNDLVPYNAARRVDFPRFDNVQDKILPFEHEDHFLWSLGGLQRDICLTVLYTGLRQKDVFRLRKDQVNFQTDEIFLIQGKTKRRVRIPLLPRLRAILFSRLKNEGDLFFISHRTGEGLTSIRSSIIAASGKIGLHLTIRDLRRTFGTRLHELGYDDKTIADLLGHVGLRSVHRYKRGRQIHKKAILDLGNLALPAKFLPASMNGLESDSLEPNVLLVETRGVEPLTSAMPSRLSH